MNHIIDLCGNPLQVSKLKDFKIGTVQYIFQPAFKENEYITPRGLFRNEKRETKLEFERMEPYGVVIGRYQGFDLNAYYPKSFSEVIGMQIANTGKRIVQGVDDLITDLFHRNKVEKKTLTIRRHSGMNEMNRLCDIPVKVYYANGQIGDVAKTDERFQNSMAHTESTILDIQALLIVADKPIVIYGNGVDVAEVRPLYDALLEVKNELLQNEQKRKEKLKERANGGVFNLFGLQISTGGQSNTADLPAPAEKQEEH